MKTRSVWSSAAPHGSITLLEINDDRPRFGREQLYEFVCEECGAHRLGLSWQEARREAADHTCSPVLITERTLSHSGQSVRLSAKECDIVQLLLSRHPSPVAPRELERLVRSDADAPRVTMPKQLMGLRRHLAMVGVALRCQSGVGYTLEFADLADLA